MVHDLARSIVGLRLIRGDLIAFGKQIAQVIHPLQQSHLSDGVEL